MSGKCVNFGPLMILYVNCLDFGKGSLTFKSRTTGVTRFSSTSCFDPFSLCLLLSLNFTSRKTDRETPSENPNLLTLNLLNFVTDVLSNKR